MAVFEAVEDFGGEFVGGEAVTALLAFAAAFCCSATRPAFEALRFGGVALWACDACDA